MIDLRCFPDLAIYRTVSRPADLEAPHNGELLLGSVLVRNSKRPIDYNCQTVPLIRTNRVRLDNQTILDRRVENFERASDKSLLSLNARSQRHMPIRFCIRDSWSLSCRLVITRRENNRSGGIDLARVCQSHRITVVPQV